MKDDRLVAALEEVASLLGIKVRYETIKKNTTRQPKGGLCHVHGEPVILIHRRLDQSEKIQVLIDALKEFDLTDVYIPPEVRQSIEGTAHLIK